MAFRTLKEAKARCRSGHDAVLVCDRDDDIVWIPVIEYDPARLGEIEKLSGPIVAVVRV